MSHINMFVASSTKLNLIVALCAYYLINFTAQNVSCSHAMKRLYEDLFTDYNRLILPVANNKTKVTVNINLKLGQILDLNLKQQILSTNVWVEQTWHDHKLSWQPELYEGIDMIHVPAENIWIPDIVLFNNADGNYELTLVAKARLYSNGTVVWKPPTMFRSTCEIDVQYFPFDIQTCFLRFGSWTYAGDEVEIRHVANKKKVEIGIDLSQFYKNVEWDIIDVPAYYNEIYYDCCEEPYPDVTFKIVMRRKMLFYLVNLILPVALMTFMTVSVFYLPSDSNEKVTLSISILTSLIVFFLLMLEIIPPTSLAVPLFGKYLLFTLVLVSLSACVSVYVLNIHHRSPTVHEMSPRMRRIFLETLPRILRLDRPDPRERSSLNRFRKKKIAQQMLQASYTSKVYDMAQPLAASLNLIETLHRSYDFNPKDDDQGNAIDEGRYFRRYVDNYVSRLKRTRKSFIDNEDDALIRGANDGNDRAKKTCGCDQSANNLPVEERCMRKQICCEHRKCCALSNQPIRMLNFQKQPRQATLSCCDDKSQPRDNFQTLNHLRNHQYHTDHADPMCPIGSDNGMTTKMTSLDSGGGCDSCTRQKSHFIPNATIDFAEKHSHLGMINDDTLDMTFDYDDQDNTSNIKHSLDQSGGLFTLSNNNLSGKFPIVPHGLQSIGGLSSHRDDALPTPPPPPRQLAHLSDSLRDLSGRMSSCSGARPSSIAAGSRYQSREDDRDEDESDDHNELVDKLLNSIKLIKDASDEMDTTTTSNADDGDGYDMRLINDDNLSKSHGALLRQRTVSREQRQSSATASVINSSIGFDRPLNQQQQQCTCENRLPDHLHVPKDIWADPVQDSHPHQPPQQQQNDYQHYAPDMMTKDVFTGMSSLQQQPSELLLSLRLPYDQMPAHVRAAIRSILFIADSTKNEDDESSAQEDWQSMSMVVDRLFLWIFLLFCTFGSIIILASAPSLYDQRDSIDDKLRIDIPLSNCSALLQSSD